MAALLRNAPSASECLIMRKIRTYRCAFGRRIEVGGTWGEGAHAIEAARGSPDCLYARGQMPTPARARLFSRVSCSCARQTALLQRKDLALRAPTGAKRERHHALWSHCARFASAGERQRILTQDDHHGAARKLSGGRSSPPRLFAHMVAVPRNRTICSSMTCSTALSPRSNSSNSFRC
jgi:hypothetical protein